MREIQGTPTYLLRLKRSTWWGRPNQAHAALLSHRATQCTQAAGRRLFSVSAQGHHPFVNLKACAALPLQLRARPKPRLQCMHMRQPPAASRQPHRRRQQPPTSLSPSTYGRGGPAWRGNSTNASISVTVTLGACSRKVLAFRAAPPLPFLLQPWQHQSNRPKGSE